LTPTSERRILGGVVPSPVERAATSETASPSVFFWMDWPLPSLEEERCISETRIGVSASPGDAVFGPAGQLKGELERDSACRYDETASDGLFTQRDPARASDVGGTYAYVNNQPVVAVDPLGLWAKKSIRILNFGGFEAQPFWGQIETYMSRALGWETNVEDSGWLDGFSRETGYHSTWCRPFDAGLVLELHIRGEAIGSSSNDVGYSKLGQTSMALFAFESATVATFGLSGSTIKRRMRGLTNSILHELGHDIVSPGRLAQYHAPGVANLERDDIQGYGDWWERPFEWSPTMVKTLQKILDDASLNPMKANLEGYAAQWP
jgi:hypothetical protein